jgi:hypothetical protein
MEIGEILTFEGKAYVLRGLDPMGVPDRRLVLEDMETGVQVIVPVSALAAEEEGRGFVPDP